MSRTSLRTRRFITLGALSTGAAAGLIWGLAVGRFSAPSAPLVLVSLGGAVLAFCGLTLFRVLEPLFNSEDPESAPIEHIPIRKRELEREKQLVLKAIREIENDYQMRKVSEKDYNEMSERYRARALRLLAELEITEAGGYRVLIEDELRARLEKGAST